MRKLREITDAVLSYHPEAEIDLINEAYLYSAKAHRGQSRHSGEAYLSHPVEVAYNLTRLNMDAKTVAAGLLHDTIEDTLATPAEIKEYFGEEVYRLVDGVTKIGQVEFASREEKQAENYRKMILAMAKDIRVVLIKLADRAHNLQTLDSVPESHQRRIARETLEIYAPLTNRLGIGWLKAELENGSFKYLYPAEYADMVSLVAQRQTERDQYVENLCDLVAKELEEVGIEGKVYGRPKHYYSIYKKMIDQKIDFKDVFDLIGVRVLTEDVKDCYSILGLIHSLWRPIPGKFKDYIAMPKPNRYQSLHTAVIGPEGHRIEAQIRTNEMNRICEEGIAAHWHYKEGDQVNPDEDHLSWVRRLWEDQKEIKNPKDFLNSFKVDLFFQEVYVFTPTGEVIALPRGATPVDFAYQVHTDIGNTCTKCKVNGRMVPLRYKLKNGDRVEIFTSEEKSPNRDWLGFVKTSKARHKIMSFINSQEREKSISLGKEILYNEIMKFNVEPQTLLEGKLLEDAIHASGVNSMENLLTGIGFGRISVHQVMEKLLPEEKFDERKQKEALLKLKEKTPMGQSGGVIKVKCFDENILWRIGKCCNPVPGDPIVGYITRGRGVSVHNEDCPSVTGVAGGSERFLEVEWSAEKRNPFPARISIVTVDKPGLLAKISNAVAECDINITRANVKQGPYKRAYFDLTIEIFDLAQLNQALEKLKTLDGVVVAERVKEYKKKTSGKRAGEDLKGNVQSSGKPEMQTK